MRNWISKSTIELFRQSVIREITAKMVANNRNGLGSAEGADISKKSLPVFADEENHTIFQNCWVKNM